ncbi:uncharacterized protein LOC111028056 [Myzus persicae]|uniref:uncharacterized protein LOC111028056 n=1 Tax=Myzus persicae TaxID=13164 RepID=UPI000B936132|nr:uncharacterized protein LOC111028056 [Myzus persicae]
MRFKGSREILKDLCFLSPQRMIEFSNNNKTLPIDAFQNISQWIPSIDLSLLKVEYITFSNNLSELLEGLGLYPDKLHNDKIDVESDVSSVTTSSSNEDKEVMKGKVNSLNVLEILSSFGLTAAFPNLYLAYKSLCTLPASSATAERSFSVVKLVKTRLLSTIGQSRLESLLILSCEKDVPINFEKVIDTFGNSSELLKKKLIFK